MDSAVFRKQEISGNLKMTKKCLTLEEKIKVIEGSEKGERCRNLAKIFNCGKTQIQSIVKNKQKIKDEWINGTTYAKPRRCQYSDLNQRVWDWVCDARSRNIQLTWKAVQDQAISFSTEMKDCDSFTASNGWLESFKQRYLKQYGTLACIDSSSDTLLTACVICGYTAVNKALTGPGGNETQEYSVVQRIFGPDFDLSLNNSSICSVCEKNLKCLVDLETEMENIEQKLWKRIQSKTQEGLGRFDKMYLRFLKKRNDRVCNQLSSYGKEGFFVYMDKNSMDIMCAGTPHAQKFLRENCDVLKRFQSTLSSGESEHGRSGVVSESQGTLVNRNLSSASENLAKVNNIQLIPGQNQRVESRNATDGQSPSMQVCAPDSSSLHSFQQLDSAPPQINRPMNQEINRNENQEGSSELCEMPLQRKRSKSGVLKDNFQSITQTVSKDTVQTAGVKKLGKGKRKVGNQNMLPNTTSRKRTKPKSLTIEPLPIQNCQSKSHLIYDGTEDKNFEHQATQSGVITVEEKSQIEDNSMVHVVSTDMHPHKKVKVQTNPGFQGNYDVGMHCPTSAANDTWTDCSRNPGHHHFVNNFNCFSTLPNIFEQELQQECVNARMQNNSVTTKRMMNLPTNPVPILLVGNMHTGMQNI